MVKQNFFLRLLLIVLLGVTLTACTAQEQTDFAVGEKVGTYWFDFTVDSIQVVDNYVGRQPKDGNKLVQCALTIENTFSQAVPMGQSDFMLTWVSEEATDQAGLSNRKGAYALAQYTPEQLPDEYDLDEDATQHGILVFQIPEEVTQVAIFFEEYYANGDSESDYTKGPSYQVWCTL